MSRRAQLPGLCCWTKFAQTSSWLSDSSPSPEILEKATSIGCLWFPRVSYFIRSWNYVQEGSWLAGSLGDGDTFFFWPDLQHEEAPLLGMEPQLQQWQHNAFWFFNLLSHRGTLRDTFLYADNAILTSVLDTISWRKLIYSKLLPIGF